MEALVCIMPSSTAYRRVHLRAACKYMHRTKKHIVVS